MPDLAACAQAGQPPLPLDTSLLGERERLPKQRASLQRAESRPCGRNRDAPSDPGLRNSHRPIYMPQGAPGGSACARGAPPTHAGPQREQRSGARAQCKAESYACYGSKAVAQGRPEGVFAPCSTALGAPRTQPKPKGAEQGWARALPYPVTGGAPCRAGPASLFGGRALQHSNQPRCAVPPQSRQKRPASFAPLGIILRTVAAKQSFPSRPQCLYAEHA